MGHRYDDLPDWEFTVVERSPGVYDVTAIRDGGISGSASGVDPDAALADLRDWAKRVEDDLSR